MTLSMTIALIDDNAAWRETLADFLAQKGFRVVTAAEGQSGLELLARPDVNFAIVDFNMPGLNGLELLNQLRKKHCEVAVVLLSSEEDPQLPERALAAGAQAFLSKTTQPRELLQLLMQTIAVTVVGAVLAALFEKMQQQALPKPRIAGYLPKPLPAGFDPIVN